MLHCGPLIYHLLSDIFDLSCYWCLIYSPKVLRPGSVFLSKQPVPMKLLYLLVLKLSDSKPALFLVTCFFIEATSLPLTAPPPWDLCMRTWRLDHRSIRVTDVFLTLKLSYLFSTSSLPLNLYWASHLIRKIFFSQKFSLTWSSLGISRPIWILWWKGLGCLN